jgi:hypothetical protein
MATSIFGGETVFFKERRFANPRYTVLTLTVKEVQFNRMLAYCESQAKTGVGFDNLGMVASFFSWFPWPERQNMTFCSAHITRVLQLGCVKEVEGYRPSKMRPSLLHRLLVKSNSKCFGSVPYKIGLMTDKTMECAAGSVAV